jgi:hypothetical protein
MRIKIEKLLAQSPHDLFHNLRGDAITVVLDGAEYTTHDRDIALSCRTWGVFKRYPKVRITPKHFISSYIKDGEMPRNAPVSLLTRVVFDTYDTYEPEYPNPAELMDDLLKLAYEQSNSIYALSASLGRWAKSFDAVDIVNILGDPEIIQAKKDNGPTIEGIEAIYDVIRKRIKALAKQGNPAAQIVDSGAAKMAQALQVLGPRGFLTNIGSTIYRIPVMDGFAEGLSSVYDYLLDTQSAAKALAHTTAPLQKSEYLSRQLQLIAMSLRRLHRGDCGSTTYMEWQVKDKTMLGGILQTASDLTILEGKYYMDTASGVLKVVSRQDTHLIGQTILLRSHLAGCQHPDIEGFCSTCFGQNAQTIPTHTGIGHYCITEIMRIITQTVISTKHFDGSAVILGIYLSDQMRKYLWAPDNSNEYYLNKSLLANATKLKLVLTNAPAKNCHFNGVSDIHHVDNVRALDITRVSQFSSIALHIVDADGLIDEVTLDLVLNNRVPSLTHEALEYIAKSHYTVDEAGRYIIDMTHWDPTQQFMKLPLRHFNMGDLRRAVELFITGESLREMEDEEVAAAETSETRRQKRTNRRKPIMVAMSRAQLMREFVDTTSALLGVPFAYLETVLLGHMSTVTEQGKLLPRPPKAGEAGRKGTMSELFSRRSMGVSMAWEMHDATLSSAAQYKRRGRDRPDSVMDVFLLPAEVMQHKKKGRYKPYCTWACCSKHAQ